MRFSEAINNLLQVTHAKTVGDYKQLFGRDFPGGVRATADTLDAKQKAGWPGSKSIRHNYMKGGVGIGR